MSTAETGSSPGKSNSNNNNGVAAGGNAKGVQRRQLVSNWTNIANNNYQEKKNLTYDLYW